MGQVKRAAMFALVALPAALGFWIAFLIWMVGGPRAPFVENGVLFFPCSDRYARFSPYSITLGLCVILHPYHGPRIRKHERVHSVQFVGDCISGAFIAATAACFGAVWWSCLLYWALHHWLVYMGHTAAAWLRGRRGYLDNAYERQARLEAGQQL